MQKALRLVPLTLLFLQCGKLDDRDLNKAMGSGGQSGAAGARASSGGRGGAASSGGSGGSTSSAGSPSEAGAGGDATTGTAGSGPAGAGAGATGAGGGAGAGAGADAEGGAGAGAGAGGQGGEGGSPTPEPPLDCAATQVTGTGKLFSGTVKATGPSAANPSCGTQASPDALIEWVAPSAGYYSLNTKGSSFASTVLGVFAPDCSSLGNSAAELGCSNAAVGGSGGYADVVRRFAAKEHVLVALEGYLAETGTLDFNADPVTCPTAGADLSGATLPAKSTSQGGTNEHSGACGGDGFPERAFRWQAPSDGVYQFEVVSSAAAPTMRPAIYLERGARCGGELLGCNASDASTPGRASVTRFLASGEVVTLIVDSLTATVGAFSVDIRSISSSCPEAPAKDFSAIALNDVVLDWTGREQTGLSCTESGSAYFLPQKSYGMTVNMSAGLSCTLTLTSDAAISAFLLRGDSCSGPEVANSCKVSTCSGGSCSLRVNFNQSLNGSYVLVIQGAGQSNIGQFSSRVTVSSSTSCIL